MAAAYRMSVALLLLSLAALVELNAQEPSNLSASVAGHSVVLHFNLGPEERELLEQLTQGCVSVEVLYSAELRKVRLLWPDARFATMLIRNKLTCDPTNQRRVLSRLVGGVQVATTDAGDDQSAVSFLATVGDSPVFDAIHFSSLSSQYSVRVRCRVIAPGREYESRADSVSITLSR